MAELRVDHEKPNSQRGPSAVRQKESYDLFAFAFGQHGGAAQITDLLVGPFDHSVAFAPLRIKHFACCRDFEPLFSGRFGFKFGHFASVSIERQPPLVSPPFF
jgi:hypothetical protein